MDSLDEIRAAMAQLQQQIAMANGTATQAAAEVARLRALAEQYGPAVAEGVQRGGTGVQAIGDQSGRALDSADRLGASIDRAAGAAEAASLTTREVFAGIGLLLLGVSVPVGVALLLPRRRGARKG